MARLDINVKFVTPPTVGEKFDHQNLASEDGLMPKRVKIVSHDDATGLTKIQAHFFDYDHAWDWWLSVEGSYGLDFRPADLRPGASDADIANGFNNAIRE